MYLERPCMFKIPQPIYPDEVFLYVPFTELPYGFNHYKVSNYGRVYDCRTESMCNKHIDSKGYEYIISAYHGVKKLYRVHRLVLAAFNYIVGCENMLVNHKDGVKTNNALYNLEWTDYSGNVIHAYRTGLINQPCGEDRSNSTITNDQARQICERLQNGESSTDIANSMGISRDIVYSIKLGRAWNSISKDYTFDKRENRFSDDDIKNICKCFESIPIANGEYKKDYVSKILAMCNCDSDKKAVDIALAIYNKRTHKNISKYYNFG